VSDGGPPALTPAALCAGLLQALEAARGRSRKRKRDQRPDAIGLELKRALLEAAVREDPPADAFEEWLLRRALAAGHGSGAVRAMALQVFDEWRLALQTPHFELWLREGAPSADRPPERTSTPPPARGDPP
jgi:hypothetical protein